MKRILCLLLSMCLLISCASCSKEPVPFSKKLFNNRNCYIDVVEITPQSYVNDVVYLYCQCKLADGSLVWMEISAENYVKYFDNDADAEDILFTARKVTYKDAVRLDGKVAKAKNIMEDKASEKVKVFRFQSADESETLKAEKRVSTAVKYKEGVKDYTVVYTDVISIEFKYTVSSLMTSSTPDSVVCECKTSDGKTVWLFSSIDNYHEFLDASALFKADFINPSNAKKLEFVEPVRLFGLTANQEDKFSTSVQGSEIASQIVEFKSADKEQIESRKIENQAPVEYSGAQKAYQPVYVDITHITPQYVLYVSYNIPQSLICECQTTDGKRVWVSIGISNYETNFFDDYADAMGVQKALSNPKRIMGRVQTAESVYHGLKDSIKQDMIIVFREIAK